MFKSAIVASCVAVTSYAVNTAADAMSSSKGRGQTIVIQGRQPAPRPIYREPVYSYGAPSYGPGYGYGPGYVKTGYEVDYAPAPAPRGPLIIAGGRGGSSSSKGRRGV